MSFSAVGQVFDLVSFRQHLAGLDLTWANSVTIHHTASPSLATRPKGFTIQHMRNIQSYYENDMKWSRGPHIFTDEDQIFGMSPLTERGVHAVSFNATSIGIEMLGNYDIEDPLFGRGLDVINTSTSAVAALLFRMGLPVNPNTVKFHRDDPQTKKTCPGNLIKKEWILEKVEARLIQFKEQNDREDPAPRQGDIPQPSLASLDARIRRLESALASSNFP